MRDDVIDPSKRYQCEEATATTRVYLKRGTPWPLRKGMQVLYKKSESSSAHWMGGLVTHVRDDGYFCIEKI